MARRAEYLGPERRRPLVLDAAQAIFAEGGFSDASMAAIAARAGVSKAVLYDCFPKGKQEIYYALLDRGEKAFLDHMLAVLDRVGKLPLEQSLREGLTGFIEYAQANPNTFRLIFGEAGTSDPEIAARAAHSRELIIAKMGDSTRAIMTAAGVPVTREAAVYNRATVAVAEEIARWMLHEPDLQCTNVVEMIVVWFMKGYERIIPRVVWENPLP